jgi:endonuclease I
MSRNRSLVLMTLLLAVAASPLLADPPAGYYNSVDATTSSTLRSTLHPVIDDHTRFPYTSSSTDTWNILADADEDPNNTSNIIDLYKNASYTKITGGNGAYNREHSWPKSLGFPDDGSSNYPYTDCHHLFAADTNYNSSRSNKPFGDCNSGCSEKTTNATNGRGGGSGVYSGNSNWTTGSGASGTWQTWSGRKGDVARAMFYMDIRYEGGSHGGTGHSEPDLRLTDTESLIASSSTGNNESIAYMGLLSVLLQWHEDDPVDVYEMYHNDMVATYQGNRNPFVDNPDWADCLYNDSCSGGGGGGSSTLSNGVAETGLGASSGAELRYTMVVPAGATDLSFAISGGSGDADLYVQYASAPTTTSYDCRPYLGGNNETCDISNVLAGTYHVMARAYSTFSGVSLTGSYTEPGGGGGGSCGNTFSASNLSGSSGTEKRFYFDVDACATTVTLTISGGTGDADLYVKFGSAPTTSNWDCRPWLNGNNETCTFSPPSTGRYEILIYGYSAFSGVTFNAEYQ